MLPVSVRAACTRLVRGLVLHKPVLAQQPSITHTQLLPSPAELRMQDAVGCMLLRKAFL